MVMRILRVLRVARIFKLARYSRGLQTFGETMIKSAQELSMLAMFLLTGIIFFSTVLYFLEKVSFLRRYATLLTITMSITL